MQKGKQIFAAVAAMALVSTMAIAAEKETGTASANTATVEELEIVQANTILTKARIKQADAINDLQSKRGVSSGGNAKPVLGAIFGTDHGVVARIICDGEVAEYPVGKTFPCGWRLDRIRADDNQVDISRGKEKLTLEFTSPSQRPQQRMQQQPAIMNTMVPAPAYVK